MEVIVLKTASRVAKLQYKIITDGRTLYQNANVTNVIQPSFSATLKDNILDVVMTDDYFSEAIARSIVQPFLDAWEIKASLEQCYGCLGFEHFSTVYEEVPFPEEGIRVAYEFQTLRIVEKATVAKDSYPEPPETFLASQEVLDLWNRYKQYNEGKESLLTMANACVTYLDMISGYQRTC